MQFVQPRMLIFLVQHRLAILLKQTPFQTFCGKFSRLSQSTIFRNISICVEESNHIKDHTHQSGVKPPPFESFRFQTPTECLSHILN